MIAFAPGARVWLAGGVTDRVRDRLRNQGKDTSPRSVMRGLSQRQRRTLDGDIVRAITEMLDALETRGDDKLFETTAASSRQRADALMERHNAIEQRLARSERKRNERRIRELRRLFEAQAAGATRSMTKADATATVLAFPAPSVQLALDPMRISGTAS